MPRRTRRISSLLVVLALAHPRWVRAAEPAEASQSSEAPAAAVEPTSPVADPGEEMKTKAMEAYRRGEAAYEAENYNEALAAFQEASSFYASPDFQYNIGRCYENLGRYVDAVRSYEIYLRATPEAADSGDVRERIGRLRGLIEAKEKADAEAEGREPEPQVVFRTPADRPPPPGRPLVISGGVLLGVGAALALGGGIGFGIVARDRSDELDEIQNGGDPSGQTLDQAQTVEDEGRQAEVGQIAMAAGGGAVAVIGVALLAVGLTKNKKARATSTTRIVPSLNRRFSGLVLTGRF